MDNKYSSLSKIFRAAQGKRRTAQMVGATLLSVFITAGCSSIPQQISTGEQVQLTEFADVIGQASVPNGSVARWGGEIIAVNNLKEYTEIELLQYPTNRYGKPLTTQESKGRFKAKVKGFVDPLVFEKGRLVTLIGGLDGLEEGIIGEQAYQYPMLAADGFHMWKKTQDVDVQFVHFVPFGLRWGTPFFQDYRWHNRGRIFRERHRVTTKSSVSSKASTASSVQSKSSSRTERPQSSSEQSK